MGPAFRIVVAPDECTHDIIGALRKAGIPLTMQELFLMKDGHPMAVLRPKDPTMKMEHLAKLQRYPEHQQTKEKFDDLVSEQPHMFMGYAGVQLDPSVLPPILDNNGDVVDEMQIADSFVSCRSPVFPWPKCLKESAN